MARYVEYLQILNKRVLSPEEKNDPDIEEKILGLILEDERGAWAYALNKIRPLVRAKLMNKDDVLQFAHENALQSYSNVFRKFLNPDLMLKARMTLVGFINTLFDKRGE